MHGAFAGMGRAGWVCCLLAAWCIGARAHADHNGPFEVPRAPRDAPASWVLEVHIDGVFPLGVSSLCPPGPGCVYSGGGGVGASAEKRWPIGLGVFGVYDVWFVDSSSVYELAVQQTLRGGGRFTWPNAQLAHPVFELSVGFTYLGDTFLVDSYGFVVQGLMGLEIELSHHFGLMGGVGLRAFSSTRFRTQRDDVDRGGGPGLSEALFLQMALTIHGRPWASAEP